MRDIIRIYFDPNWNVIVQVSLWLLIITLILLAAASLFMRRWRSLHVFEFDEAELGIGKHKIKFRPNRDDRQIAYKLWVELSTRKIGLPIDPQLDVISEVYSSWYEFFRLTRELIKTVPIQKLRNSESTQQIVDVAIRVLNDELRPHLTKWQARYRRWYEHECAQTDCATLPPQLIQRRFPEITDLFAEMQAVNVKLTAYRENLRLLAFGE